MKFKQPKYWTKFAKALRKSGKRICYIDIETSPALVYTFHIGNKVSISHEQVKEPVKIISIQYMFEGDTKPTVLHWDKNHCDKAMLEKAIPILAKADVLVAQNGDAFDMKVLNWRIKTHALPALTNAYTIDTLKLSRGSFKPLSHKLDYRAKMLGMDGKIKMCFQDWVNVMEDKPGGLEKMLKYGARDIPLLRNTFMAELPYYRNLQSWMKDLLTPKGKTRDPNICPICGEHGSSKGWKGTYRRMAGRCGHTWKEHAKKVD